MSDDPNEMTDRVIGGYLVAKHIGRGRHGHAYLATQLESREVFGLKLFDKGLFHSAEARRSCRRHFMALARTPKSLSIRVQDVIYTGDTLAVVVNHREGMTALDIDAALPLEGDDATAAPDLTHRPSSGRLAKPPGVPMSESPSRSRRYLEADERSAGQVRLGRGAGSGGFTAGRAGRGSSQRLRSKVSGPAIGLSSGRWYRGGSEHQTVTDVELHYTIKAPRRVVAHRTASLTVDFREEGNARRLDAAAARGRAVRIAIEPLIPGAVVTPPRAIVNLSREERASFVITPVATGDLSHAKLILKAEDGTHYPIRLAIHSTNRGLARWLFRIAFIVLVALLAQATLNLALESNPGSRETESSPAGVSTTSFMYRSVPKDLRRLIREYDSRGSRALLIGWGALLAIAALTYLAGGPRRAPPLEGTFALGRRALETAPSRTPVVLRDPVEEGD
ncbi:MAG: hypothetical protein ACYS22_02205 [Planctomycetota bacterium]|jgi:hypothetical protein